MTPSSSPLTVRRADETDRAVLEQLWTMFRHDMSAYTGALPDARGRFRHERLDAALADPSWCAYLMHVEGHPAGLAAIRGLRSPERVISSFFLAGAVRRRGHGREAVRLITRQHPGPWAVAYQDANRAAAAFWPAVAAEADERWTLTHRAVPGNPALPPDAWVRFTVSQCRDRSMSVT